MSKVMKNVRNRLGNHRYMDIEPMDSSELYSVLEGINSHDYKSTELVEYITEVTLGTRVLISNYADKFEKELALSEQLRIIEGEIFGEFYHDLNLLRMYIQQRNTKKALEYHDKIMENMYSFNYPKFPVGS